MTTKASDELFLQRALELAQAGVGLASPNPHVGAVITDPAGNIVGTGTYTYAGVKHAEILALDAAGAKASGGTLYINLEPHAHRGRTPPCTDALISAGIRRVVASVADPNPKVSGRGFQQLREAGVAVEVGGLEEQARRLNEGFARYIRSRLPLVTLKSALTLDGKIASGRRHASMPEQRFTGEWITGERARNHAHQLRHESDAILVGLGTIVADNPLLTDRSGAPRRRPLLRIVLDSRLRLPLDSRLVQNAATARQSDVLIFCTTGADKGRKEKLEHLGVRVEQVPVQDDSRVNFGAVLRKLGEMEMTSLLIEGGSAINGAALASHIVDKVWLCYAPIIFGNHDSVPFAATDRIDSVITLKNLRRHTFAEDTALEGYLRDPYIE
jgi:diaminohydroxyphosphoribosylaminopyrimidine deaminase/5-amino-6-(5-phosphoribosylamino)uracil reductase